MKNFIRCGSPELESPWHVFKAGGEELAVFHLLFAGHFETEGRELEADFPKLVRDDNGWSVVVPLKEKCVADGDSSIPPGPTHYAPSESGAVCGYRGTRGWMTPKRELVTCPECLRALGRRAGESEPQWRPVKEDWRIGVLQAMNQCFYELAPGAGEVRIGCEDRPGGGKRLVVDFIPPATLTKIDGVDAHFSDGTSMPLPKGAYSQWHDNAWRVAAFFGDESNGFTPRRGFAFQLGHDKRQCVELFADLQRFVDKHTRPDIVVSDPDVPAEGGR